MIRTVGDLRRALEPFEDWDAFQIEMQQDGQVYEQEVQDISGPHAIGARCRIKLTRGLMPIFPLKLRRY